jgi:hypothetical protein
MKARGADSGVAEGVEHREKERRANQQQNVRNRRHKHEDADFSIVYCHG